jgi:hypothetical protein
MSNYIVCLKKRNNPRIDIRVCQKKCDLKEDCKEYISLLKILHQNQETSISVNSQPGGSG